MLFFFNDTATTEIYTLSLHDALPICPATVPGSARGSGPLPSGSRRRAGGGDRKSTRLNSSHSQISYAVFCLKKKKSEVPPPRDADQTPVNSTPGATEGAASRGKVHIH